MLPPKRLLWMLAGLLVCLALYQVYLFFLGGYDGLTPLPAEYWPGQVNELPQIRDTPNPEPPVVRKLRLAFGPQAKEAERPILIESVQHGMVLAAQKAFLNADGKLELEQVSVALFGKKKTDPAEPDICTLQGDRAIIEFDKPLTSVRDVANRKPVAGRIEGGLDPASGKINQVHLRHSRRTANPDDDLHLYTDWLQYDDRQHRIWTDAAVEIVDGDPDTGKITGIGLEVFLETESPSKAPNKPARGTITGVRSVELGRNVQMYFQLEAHTALFGGAGKPGRTSTVSPAAPPTLRPPDAAAADRRQASSTTPLAAHASLVPAKPARRSPVKVIAEGPFIYRVPEDRAEFHHRVHLIRLVPADAICLPSREASAPAKGSSWLDELHCQSLTLQFRRKNRDSSLKPGGTAASQPAKPEDAEAAIELVSARAVGEPVELHVESESLHATGTELVFDRASNSAMLVGKPLEALYDGHRLQVTGTLTLRASENQMRELREAQARGPGTAWLRGRQADQVALIVRWREQMHLVRDGSLERLLLSGNVLLEEPQRGSLRADHLLLWLELAAPKTASAGTAVAPAKTPIPTGGAAGSSTAAPTPIAGSAQTEKAAAGRIPRCLEASGNVSLQSETFVVPHTDRLRVELHNEAVATPPVSEPATAATPGAIVSESAAATGQPTHSAEHNRHASPTASPPGAGGKSAPSHSGASGRTALADASLPSASGMDKSAVPTETGQATKPNRPPLVLRARTIEAIAAGSPTRAELRAVSAQGQVQVEQPPASPQDRPWQIRCGLLHLQRTANGDILRLEGTPVQPASVQFGQLAMRGPVIKIDQVLNTVDVEGLGSMRLPTRSDFQGNPLREPAEVVVDWNQSMFFDGRLAEFDGGVQAVQGNSRLACRRLSLLLDRKVSLREQKTTELNRGETPAALSRLMCEQDVRLEKAVLEADRYQLLQRIEARELAYDHETATLTAYGPGVVQVFQPASDAQRYTGSAFSSGPTGPAAGNPSSTLPPASKPNPVAPSAANGFKLTRIRYDGHMQATKAADRQTDVITFTGGVQLVHVPASDPDEPVDPDRLPDDGLSLSCGQLKITNRKLENGGSAQELLALQGVRVRARQFYAHADRVSFDEAKDLLVLEGSSGATLYRQKVPGGEYEPVRAKRIWFWRRDNRVRFDGTESIHINP